MSFASATRLWSRRASRRVYATAQVIPAEMSLWSISSSEMTAFPRLRTRAPVSPLEGHVLRLDRLTSIVESASPFPMDESDEDAANWLAPRVDRIASSQNTVQTMRRSRNQHWRSAGPRSHRGRPGIPGRRAKREVARRNRRAGCRNATRQASL